MTNLDGWIPIRVYAGAAGYRVDWCYFGPRRLTEPFFRDSVEIALQEPFNLAFRQDTTIDSLLNWAHMQPGIQPTAFIYHTSRCGSTLLSRMLMALESHVVVSEPPLLDAVLRAHYSLPTLPADVQVAWVRATLSALAQRRIGTESRFVVKLDAWNITELPLMRSAFPDVPWIFLYRDPLEVAVSQLKMPGAHMVPGVLGPSLASISADEAIAMPRAEFIARILGRIFESGHEGCLTFGGRPVHYRELPDALWTSLAGDFGVATDVVTIEALHDAARLDAKNPHFEFVSDTEQKHRASSEELRRAVDRWAAPAYAALEALGRVTVAQPDAALVVTAPVAPPMWSVAPASLRC
jgi:hypothetical protein